MRAGNRSSDYTEPENNASSTVERESGIGELNLTLELTAEMLMAIRIAGVYNEIVIDRVSGRILARIHLIGRYDSYSDVYELNARRWKLCEHVSLPSGMDLWRMRLDES